MSEKLARRRARKRLSRTRLPMRTVAMKYGMQLGPETNIQSHIDSDLRVLSENIGFIKQNLFITNPFSTEDSKDNHEAMEEVNEVPSWHLTSWPHALLRPVVIPVELHSHHGKDEDDDADHKGEVGKTSDYAPHDGQDVVERLPRLGQLENPEETQRS